MSDGPGKSFFFSCSFFCRVYYIRAWMVMDLSIEVMWRFAKTKKWTEEDIQREWKLKKGRNYKQDPKKWDIVLLRDVILGLGIVQKTSAEYKALDALVRCRNDNFGHVRGGIDKETYENLVKTSQKRYQELLGTDEQKKIDKIQSSKECQI